MNVVASPALRLRKLTVADNPAIAHVIRQVSAEYGLTADKGYTVADPNLDELYQVDSQPGHAYWVVRLTIHLIQLVKCIVSLATHIGWLSTRVKWSAAVGLRH